MNDDYRSLSQEYAQTQSRLVQDVLEIAASYAPPLEQLNVVLAHLDVTISLAQVSSQAPIPYTRPRVVSSDEALRVEASRHPCVEVQDEMHFIPNDVQMEPGKSSFLVITGPNMGGKSTYLRQIGLLTVLAQMGCYVPAAEGAQIPVCDAILARVGAGDSQLRGVSTFMAEMLETATILKTATRDSLVLIDELGRGTSTYDGFGLAWAISEWIVKELRCKCVFATHFHEMTNLAKEWPDVQNMHVLAHVAPRDGDASRLDRDITLLYKVEPGSSDQSYGIQIAELADFPPRVIRLAKRKAEELEEGHDTDTLPAEEVERGVQLMRTFVEAWTEQTKARREGGTSEEDAQRQALQTCMDKYGSQIDAHVCIPTHPAMDVARLAKFLGHRLLARHTHVAHHLFEQRQRKIVLDSEALKRLGTRRRLVRLQQLDHIVRGHRRQIAVVRRRRLLSARLQNTDHGTLCLLHAENARRVQRANRLEIPQKLGVQRVVLDG